MLISGAGPRNNNNKKRARMQCGVRTHCARVPNAHARKQNGEICLTFEFLRTADDEARLKTERFTGQSSPTYSPAQTGRGRPCQYQIENSTPSHKISTISDDKE